MSDLIYLYTAYSIIWIGLLLYMVKLHLAQHKLRKEIDVLRETLNGQKSKKNL